MKFVLLSGGSGKRLWPLSNDSRSKQFLKVLKSQDGTYESMVQRVKGQITKFHSEEDIYIATSKSQSEMIYNQLGSEITLLVEPERRDTFPAIALAASYLYSVVGISLDEVVCVLPVDPYVEDGFFQSMSLLEDAINNTSAELALMGVKPTYPSEKYGYIVPSAINSDPYQKVDHFVEKPNSEMAEELISKNAFWNCGVFAFKLDKIITKLEEKGLPVNYEVLLNQYHTLVKTSFDYEVVEQSKNIVFIPYNGGWKDLGTWNTLTEEMESSLIGNGHISEECQNTHVINELDLPVTVLGISNAIVAISPDGILVSDKELSPRVKDIVSNYSQRPMYEERLWGSYRVLDYTSFPDEEVLTRRIILEEGKHLSYQYHKKRKEIWTVLAGYGEIVLNGDLKRINPGDVIEINPHDLHAIKAITRVEFIEVQVGSEIIEEDIYRVQLSWDQFEELLK